MKKIILFGVLLILMTALVSCNKIAFDDDGVFEFYPTGDGYFVAVRDPEYVQYMESVEIPMLYKLKPVVGIANNGFAHCSNLKQITIPSGVEKIGDSAFEGCESLESITIPDSVTSIGSYAFRYCYSLTNIKYRGTEAEWESISKGYRWDMYSGAYGITYNYDGE